MMRVILVSVCCLLFAIPLSAQDARKIMTEVDKVESAYQSSVRRWTLSTCKYTVKNRRMRCMDKPKKNLLENIHKDYPTQPNSGEIETRSFDIIVEPIRDKGTCLLAYSYAKENSDTDFWMYLPALGKTKRLLASSDGGESASLFGSEFSIEDSENRKLKDYTYKLIGEKTYRKRSAWVIESTPTPARAKKSAYSKILSWVDKKTHLILKDELFDRNGKLYKQLVTTKFEQIDNVWIVTKSSMNNLRIRRISNYHILSVGFNMEVDDKIFSQRALTDFAFREKEMNKYRKFLK